MQFRLRLLIYVVAFLCVWLAVFSYFAFHRPVQFHAHGYSWAVNGPTSYLVWVETTEETDGVFLERNRSRCGLNMLMFQKAGTRHNDDPDPITHGTKHTFPIQPEYEVKLSHLGKRWRYRFTFPKKPMRMFIMQVFGEMVMPTVVIVAITLAIWNMLPWQNKNKQAGGEVEKQPIAN